MYGSPRDEQEPILPLTPRCPNCGRPSTPHCKDANTVCTWRNCLDQTRCRTYFDPTTRRVAVRPELEKD